MARQGLPVQQKVSALIEVEAPFCLRQYMVWYGIEVPLDAFFIDGALDLLGSVAPLNLGLTPNRRLNALAARSMISRR